MAKRQGIRRVASSLSQAVRRVATRLRPGRARLEAAEQQTQPAPMARKTSGSATAATRKHVESDIPLDRIANQYTPSQAASKTGFHAGGREMREELAEVADDRFNDEDRFTNKSGDPRIGTHRRKYQSDERDRDEVR